MPWKTIICKIKTNENFAVQIYGVSKGLVIHTLIMQCFVDT